MKQIQCELEGGVGITFLWANAEEITDDQYRAAQALERNTFRAALTRTQDEVDHLVDWHNPDGFIAARRNPMLAVLNGRLNPNQSFSKPNVVLAYEGDDLVGYTYSANNVSGNITQQAIKRFRGQKNYVWFREMAVHPDLRRQGIGRTLGFLALQNRKTKQNVTAYVWEELPGMKQRLEKLGFSSTGSTNARVFGPDKAPAKQHRMQVSANQLISRLASIGTLLPKRSEAAASPDS